jgi:hypothetical protein
VFVAKLPRWVVTFDASSSYSMEGDGVLFYATIRDDDGQIVYGSQEISVTTGEEPWDRAMLLDEGEDGDLLANDGVHSAWRHPGEAGPLEAKLFFRGELMASIGITITAHPRLVVVTDIEALYNQLRATGMPEQADEDENGVQDFYQLLNRLNKYAAGYKGVVYDVRANIVAGSYFPVSYGSLTFEGDDPATNRVRMAELIDQALTGLHHDSQHTIADVVLVGSDEVVPFYRLQDPSDPDILYPAGANNPTALDLLAGYLVTDLPYGTVDYVNQAAALRPTPQIPVGRIAGALPLEMIDILDGYEKPILLVEDYQTTALLIRGEEHKS